jgi:cytoskeletal protein CcmA (bactofilin family)
MADNPTSTVIGESILINGNLNGDEDLTVLGRVEGTINLTKTLNIEESGIVKANISVRNAVISGVVVGNITASDSVEITEVGRMVGDIKAPRVIIVDGARYRGAVDMGDLEAPRATGGELPKRTSTPRAALPAATTKRPSAPVPSAPAKKPEAAPQKTVAMPAAKAPGAAPVLGGKQIKKKVVVKKKG